MLLSFLSLLVGRPPNLSDVAETANLRAFSLKDENILQPAVVTLLNVWIKVDSVPVHLLVHMCFSQQPARRHQLESPRMTDDSLRSVATLENLQNLEISRCNRDALLSDT